MNKFFTWGKINLQFITSFKDLNQGEEESNRIIEWLLINQDEINFSFIGDCKIFNIDIQQIAPLYIGPDGEKRYSWSFECEIVVEKIQGS